MESINKADSKAEKRIFQAACSIGLTVYEWNMATGAMIFDDCSGMLEETPGSVQYSRSTWEKKIHEDDKGRVAKFVTQRTDTGPCEIEYRVKLKNKGFRWVRDRFAMIEHRGPNPLQTVTGFLLDITREKEKQKEHLSGHQAVRQALQQSESEKQAILDALEGLVDIKYLDPDRRIVWDNAGLLGRSSSKSPIQPYCYELIWGRSTPCKKECSPLETFKAGEVKKKETLLEDGRTFIEVASPVKDEDGAVQGVVFITLNITQQRKIEQNYRQTHEYLHSFLKNLPAPISVFSADGTIELVNPAWENLVGLKADLVLGKRFEDIFSSETAQKISRSNQEILRQGKSLELEETMNFPGGFHYFHTVKFPLRDTRNRLVVGMISMDHTARKLAEKELESREAELERKSIRLEETNTALKVLLAQREDDQKEMERRIIMNVKELALPYVYQLKKMDLNMNQLNYLEILESHLNDIITPFMRRVVTDHPDMTAREIEVAALVREGKTNKDIADLMNLSVNTIQIHRHNLRKKLGIKNKKKNLRSYLLSIDFSSGTGR